MKILSVVDAQEIIRALENGVIAGAEYLNEMKAYQSRYGGL